MQITSKYSRYKIATKFRSRCSMRWSEQMKKRHPLVSKILGVCTAGLLIITAANSAHAQTLVIDGVLMEKTPQTGTWLFCFQAISGVSTNTFHIPDKKYEGDGTFINMGLQFPNVQQNQSV